MVVLGNIFQAQIQRISYRFNIWFSLRFCIYFLFILYFIGWK